AGGGFAVGRFSGESHLPVVYTEMDGGMNTNGAPRRVSRAVRSNRVRESGGIGRVFRNFLSFFGRIGSRSSLRSSSEHSQLRSVFNRVSRRRSRTWVLQV
ncbi:DUF1117 domain-containing protein, partial [Escherichia coli]|nr:DUF1117 domain-containing protein [Escherichia coli]